ncbi:hypothetical protein ABMA28_002070 [Loxostege sticticalis]|uniref:Uncharacterized protein n=1 Tax=Loxostege sticticalis TaxID=481309 RepID=A0ABD0SZM9_LOXSC
MEICRACLVTEQSMIPLDETSVTNYNLLTNLNVSLQDGMPQNLCPNCAQAVRSFTKFREKSILSETTLREVIQVKEPKDENFKIGLCVKQEVKDEVDSNNFDDFDYQDVESEFPIKLEEDPVTKHTKAAKLKKKKNKSKHKTVTNNSKKHGTKSKTTQLFPCGICKKKFEEVDLKSHLQMHMKYTECEICHERFGAWPSLLAHRLEHIPNKKAHCHLCNKRYVSSISLEYHYLTAHNNGQQAIALKCKICQGTYKTPKKLRDHVSTSHGEARFFCDCCSKGFTTKSCLRIHLKSHSDHKSIVCDLCGFQCNLKQGLKAHKLRKHTPNTVTCKGCTMVFVNQESHDRHKCKTKEVPCPDCGKMISSRVIGRHMQTHKVASYKCPRCPAAYKSRTALRVHVDRHDGVRRLQCEHCPAKFYSHAVLIKHRRTHTGEKPYVCYICGKGFTGGHNLKVHMKVHGIFSIVKKDSLTENIGDIFQQHNL